MFAECGPGGINARKSTDTSNEPAQRRTVAAMIRYRVDIDNFTEQRGTRDSAHASLRDPLQYQADCETTVFESQYAHTGQLSSPRRTLGLFVALPVEASVRKECV